MAANTFRTKSDPFDFHVGQYLSQPILPCTVFNLLYSCGLANAITRFLLASYCISVHRHEHYFAYDQMLSMYYHQLAIQESSIFGTFGVNFLIIIYTHYLLDWPNAAGDVFHLFADLVWDVVEEDMKQTWKAALCSPFTKLWRKVTLIWQLKHHQVTLGNRPLRYFSRLNNQNRQQILLLWCTCEITLIVISLSWCCILIAVFALFYLPYVRFGITSLLSAVFDIVAFSFTALVMFKQLLFIICCIATFAVALLLELANLNRPLMVQQQHGPKGQTLTHLCRILGIYRHRHTQICSFLSRFNRQLVSPFFSIYISATVVFNISGFLTVFCHRPTLFMRNLLFTFALITFAVPLAVALLLSLVNQRISCTRSRLVNVLLHLNAQHSGHHFARQVLLREMIKSSHYFEILNGRKRVAALTAGIYGLINRRKILEFFLIYAAYMLHFLSNFLYTKRHYKSI